MDGQGFAVRGSERRTSPISGVGSGDRFDILGSLNQILSTVWLRADLEFEPIRVLHRKAVERVVGIRVA